MDAGDEQPFHPIARQEPIAPAPDIGQTDSDARAQQANTFPLAGWWDASVPQPLWNGGLSQLAVLDDLVARSLLHSLQVKVASDKVVIRQTTIQEATSKFDWSAFVESKWRDIDEPVGSTLTTGGPPRLQDTQSVNKAGLRRRSQIGGEFEAYQQLGTEKSNSNFFLPPTQGQTRLALSYRQPLLRGAGRRYNQALIVIAILETDAARDEFLDDLQDHLFDITRGYWGLYQERAVLLQRRRSVARVAELLQIIERRQDLDVVSSQLVRAQAAYEQRRASLVRAEAGVRNAEARLKLLINDPDLPAGAGAELLPSERPYGTPPDFDFDTAVATALHNRPDIARSIKGIKAASVQMEMTQKELLPALELVLETYAMGLDGNYNVSGALGDQFSKGAPSYTAGLVFEVPLGNRAAQARLQRRRLEMRLLQTQMQVSVEQVKVDVELAAREVTTSFREMNAEFAVMQAAERELNYLQNRWLRLPGEDGAAGLMLDDLLSAQNALVESESAFVRAQAAYNVALVGLQRTTGTLLHNEGIVLNENHHDDLPRLVVEQIRNLPTPFMLPEKKPAAHTHSGERGASAP